MSFISTDDDLELLRSIVRRVIEPMPYLQTGFWIDGPAGKSGILAFRIEMRGNLAAEISFKNCTLLTNAHLKGKSLSTASDVDTLMPEAVRLFKTILRRDRVPYDWKNEMVQNLSF
uniref:Uncharacterized protein orf115a n=1 Tax=Staurastrum punctulatum TaxID=102822 RepID=Q32S11_STAPU|nr:hypothetical protein StpuCp001 [Staurastrum punctulatum]AAX45780.1 hypothetical protein [Staurastrum punctulatum]